MGLVDYSDSEASDVDDTKPTLPAAKATTSSQPSKAAFNKVVNPSEPRKIKVDLPSVRPDTVAKDEEQPPAKRARTVGTFSGFNSLLPAPKRAAVQNAPRAGVSLKTSSEAAFSRAPPPLLDDDGATNGADEEVGTTAPLEVDAKADEEKIVGKATKFKPLSVANRKWKPRVAKTPAEAERPMNGSAEKEPSVQAKEGVAKEPPPPLPKPKRSLFSVPQEEAEVEQSVHDVYHSITADTSPSAGDTTSSATEVQPQAADQNPNSLKSLTSDLNLTPAQRRQLFGRHAKEGDVNIAHFNMENEYAANEQLRQAGEVVEHRAIKAIAPGKHSLQQLVNNARTQQDAIEDKWAQGRKDRGEGGAKYGWTR